MGSPSSTCTIIIANGFTPDYSITRTTNFSLLGDYLHLPDANKRPEYRGPVAGNFKHWIVCVDSTHYFDPLHLTGDGQPFTVDASVLAAYDLGQRVSIKEPIITTNPARIQYDRTYNLLRQNATLASAPHKAINTRRIPVSFAEIDVTNVGR